MLKGNNLKKLITLLLVAVTISIAEEITTAQTNDINTTEIKTTDTEKPVAEEKSILNSIGYSAGAVLGGITYGAVAIITAPLHLFDLNK